MKKTHERAEIFAQKKAEALKDNFSNYTEDQECNVIDHYIKERLKFFEAQATQNRDIPLDIFPGIYGRFAKEYAKVYQHPNNYIFGGMLSAISTVIGMSVVLHTKKYKNSGSFYGMLIGKSGSAKTHSLEYFLSPIIEIEKEITKKYNVDYNRWKRNETSGDRPIKQNITINSGTSEAILKRLENSPKGFINYIDEIESFFRSRDPNSSAIPDLLTIWNNQRINKGLKDNQNDYNVESPFMNLLGGIQIEELVNRFKTIGTSNGLLWRFIPFINTQNSLPYDNDLEIDLKLKTTFDHEIKYIYYSLYRDTIEIDQDTEKLICTPKRLLLDIESNIIYNDYVKYCIFRQNNTPNNKIDEVLAKVKIYCLRFALIFHVAKRGTDFKKYPEIEEDTMWRAVQLSEHLFAAQKYCLDMISGEGENIFGISKKYLDFYKALPNEPFKTNFGNEMAKRYKISERMVFDFYKNVNFFKKVSHGIYSKTNFI
jgi:hypothetical protein